MFVAIIKLQLFLLVMRTPLTTCCPLLPPGGGFLP